MKPVGTAKIVAVNRLVDGSNPSRGATPQNALWFRTAFRTFCL